MGPRFESLSNLQIPPMTLRFKTEMWNIKILFLKFKGLQIRANYQPQATKQTLTSRIGSFKILSEPGSGGVCL